MNKNSIDRHTESISINIFLLYSHVIVKEIDFDLRLFKIFVKLLKLITMPIINKLIINHETILIIFNRFHVIQVLNIQI